MNHHTALASPWSRDRVEPRDLTAAENAAREYLRQARQQSRNAQALTRAAIAALPANHPALVDMGLFADEQEWTIDAYIGPALADIEALPGVEAQDEEDRLAEGKGV